MLDVELFWNQCGIVGNSLFRGSQPRRHDMAIWCPGAQHFAAFSPLSLDKSGNPLSSCLGAPVFGGALQLLISQRRTADAGIKG